MDKESLGRTAISVKVSYIRSWIGDRSGSPAQANAYRNRQGWREGEGRGQSEALDRKIGLWILGAEKHHRIQHLGASYKQVDEANWKFCWVWEL